MFGYVNASWKELTQEQKDRYGAVYCGICRKIRSRSGDVARLGLSYDMAFLALLLMSLYEPEEARGRNACLLHPVKRRSWVDHEIIGYGADMNVALSYYNCLDDWQDEHSLGAKAMADCLRKRMPQVQERYPRQCEAIRSCIEELNRLEQENCPDPDRTAGSFGRLMGELFVWKEDLWRDDLYQMGFSLGRFIYLLDGALDYDKDRKKGKFNPYFGHFPEKNWPVWEEYLILAMARCTESYERLPLVQDKALLDNILYSGVWITYRAKRKKEEETGDDRRSV